jgi:hypothetical protein
MPVAKSWMLRFVLATLCAAATAMAAPEATKAELEARAIITEIKGRVPVEGYASTGRLKIRDAKGKRREVAIAMKVVPGTNTWTTEYTALSAEGKPTEALVVERTIGGAVHSKVLSGPEGDAKDVLDAGWYLPFAGSDFLRLDLSIAFLDWPNQKLLKREMKKSRPCRVIESAPATVSKEGYSKVTSWVDAETGDIVMARAYDSQNRVLKEFHVGGVRKVNGQWEVKEIEMVNEQTDSATRLEFDPIQR